MDKVARYSPAVFLFAVAAALTWGCSGSDGPLMPGTGGMDGSDGAAGVRGEGGSGGFGDNETGSVFGEVKGTNGTPIPAVTVATGAMESITNEEGFFVLSNLAADSRVVLAATAAGYASTTKVVTPQLGASTFVEITLAPFLDERTFDSSQSATVQGGGARVDFPANSLDADGMVRAQLTALDVTNPTQLAAFPGEFTTSNNELMETLGLIAIEVTDMDGDVVQLRDGQFASVQIPVTAGAADEIPLWSLDGETGLWVREGTLTNCSSGVCQGQIAHMSWWNADIVLETTCLEACVVDPEGNPSVGVWVEAEGVDYFGWSSGVSGADGCLCLNVKRAATVAVTSMSYGWSTDPIVHQTATEVAMCGDPSCERLPTNLVPPCVADHPGEPDLLWPPEIGPSFAEPGSVIEFPLVVDGDTRLVKATLMDAWRLATTPPQGMSETFIKNTTGDELLEFAIPIETVGRYYVDLELCGSSCDELRAVYTLNRANAGPGSDAINDPYERVAFTGLDESGSELTCFNIDSIAIQQGTGGTGGSGGVVGAGGAGGAGGGSSGSGCVHDGCVVGQPPPVDCNSCTEAVCALDSVCCAFEWDSLCVEAAGATPECGCDPGTGGTGGTGGSGGMGGAGGVGGAGGSGGPCVHDACVVGQPPPVDCNSCTEAVCALDSVCCDSVWDEICVEEAGATPECGCSGVACLPPPTSTYCSNSQVNPIEPCCQLEAPPVQADACTATESLTNPTSCLATGTTVRYRLTMFEVESDCSRGYDLDGCFGYSCIPGGLAPLEGFNGVDNALGGVGPVVAAVGGNLGGVNQAFADAFCGLTDSDEVAAGCQSTAIPPLDLQLIVEANVEENCATVTVEYDGTTVGSVLMNLSDTGCLSGVVGLIPFEIGGIEGLFRNSVLRATVSEAGLSDGLLGTTVDLDTATAVAEALLEGGGAIAAQLADISSNLINDTTVACDGFSASYRIGGVAQ